MSNTVTFYNPCASCGTTGDKLVIAEDAEGKASSYSTPGMMFVLCPACGRHSRPQTWNQVNSGDNKGAV